MLGQVLSTVSVTSSAASSLGVAKQRVTDLRNVVDCDGGGGVVEHPLDEAVRQGGRADDGSAVQDGACWRRKGSASLHHGQNISSVAQALVEVVGGRGEVSDDVYEELGRECLQP